MSYRPPIWILYKIHIFGFMSQHLCVSGSSARSMSPDSCLSIPDPCCRIRSSAAVCISGSSTRSTSSDSCLSIFVSHGFSARSTSPDSCLSIFISQDPLQDPCLRIHVSDSCLTIHQYGSSARSMSPGSCLSIFLSQDSLQDPCLRIHVSASTNMDPLQDPRLRIHVSASLYLRLLCKIYVSGSVYNHPYVSQEPLQDPCLRIHVSESICISGTSARSMSPDPYISIHMYLRIRCKIHVSDSCRSILLSQGPLQDPFLRIHGSASWYLRILCKIHVSGFMAQHLDISGSSARSMSPGSCLSIFASQDPLQDPCLRIHVSASSYLRILCKIHVSDSCLGSSARSMLPGPKLSSHMYLRILYKIHVFGFMSQHLRISGSSARSMCPIHVVASTKMDPLQDPHLRTHVSASLYLMDSLQDPCLRIHVAASIYTRWMPQVMPGGI